MWCDKDKHNAAVSLSLIVYCFSLLQISSLAGIRLCSRHLRPIKNKHRVWFDLLDDFNTDVFFLWWPVGGMVMKGLTEPSLFAALVFHISGGGTNKPEITVSVHKITGWADSPSTRMYQFARMYFRPIQCKVNPFILIIRQTNDKWQVLSKVMVQLFCFPISSIFHPSIKFHFDDIVCWWNSLCWHFLLPLANFFYCFRLFT